jgi:ADP-ribose pyrophosphatase YjhB (NUDIX family)
MEGPLQPVQPVQPVHPVVRVLAWIWTHLPDDRLRSRLMWWLNAKFAVGVTGVVRNGSGEILFVEHAFRRRYPWALPGGWIGRREELDEALLRELREETGLTVEVERLVAAHTFALPRLDVAFLCRVRGGTVRPSAETPRWRWCRPDDPPPGADPYSLRLVQLALEQTQVFLGGRRGVEPRTSDVGLPTSDFELRR